MKDGVVVSGANSNMLRITNIEESDEGVYQCVASNKGGQVESNPATITVYGMLETNMCIVYLNIHYQVHRLYRNYHKKFMQCWVKSFRSHVLLLMIKMLQQT